jgi:hypothetical protein
MDIDRATQAAAISSVLNLLTDEEPIINDYGSYSMIRFTPGQQAKISKLINDSLTGKPGAIRFDAAPIVNPIIIKQAIPYAVALIAAGFLLGRLSSEYL